MTEEPGSARRRRRRRARSAQGPPTRAVSPPASPDPQQSPPASPAPPPERPDVAPPQAETRAPAATPPRKRRAPRESGERGLRDIVGAGSSQLGVSGALRGRDVNRPTDEDLAEAERDVVIVRRNWKPDDRQ
jgi:hypothetical protein